MKILGFRLQKSIYRCTATALALSLLFSLSEGQPIMNVVHSAEAIQNEQLGANDEEQVTTTEFEPRFSMKQEEWKQQGISDSKGSISVNGNQFSAHSEDALVSVAAYQGRSNVLIWKTAGETWIEYEIVAPEEGLYEISMSYHPYSEVTQDGVLTNRRPAVLSLTVDGLFPFYEARALPMPRQFRDERPIKQDEFGDDIRPKPAEVQQWNERSLRDSDSRYDKPLKWHFTKGSHTLRFFSQEPIVIESITLKAPAQLEAYAEVSAAYPEVSVSSKEAVIIQAEDMFLKNDVAIQIQSNQDPAMQPKAKGRQIYNSVGGSGWMKGGQTITWKFTVPETGTYKLAMRTLQNLTSNKANFRTLYIDGEVPFEEMLSYRLPYSNKWQGTILSDYNDKAFEFYLEKGEHTIAMEATYAPLEPILSQIESIANELRLLSYDMKTLTGGEVDKNRTWKVEEFPELPPRLSKLLEEITAVKNQLIKVNGKNDNFSQNVNSAADDIKRILKYPNDIPYYTDDIATVQSKIGQLIDQLPQSPLQLDQIYVVPAEADFPKMAAGNWSKLKNGLSNFFYSFIKKDDMSSGLDENVLNVWVTMGRDYVNLLQELSDEYFTPEFGIKVKVNLLPDQSLLIKGNAAGMVPDIAMGIGEGAPVDYAIRNAVVDLSKLKDFEQFTKNYAPGSLLQFYYDGGYYGLPQAQSFKVLFYRKDIMERLGFGIPNTWEDVVDMLPSLQQNGMNFYLAPDYQAFTYQNGADFFSKDGLESGLDTPEAFKGFKQLVNMYNIYGIDRQVNSFYQHFRDGTMPIGVADFNFYLQMAVAAPELTGWWGIAPMPGIEQANGSIARWAQGGQQAVTIFKKSEKQELAWEYVKWWLSAETQERYGSDLESIYGMSFRWNTANLEAFTRLPWKKEEMAAILEQWRWYKEVPIVPGSYFVDRELSNAWNRTVIEGMNYRSSLEMAVMEINRELIRKQQEFGIVDENGKPMKTLDLPQIIVPWDGVDKYAVK